MKVQGENKSKYFLMLVFVVVMWGCAPLVSKYLFNFFSPGIKSVMSSAVTVIAMLIICAKKLKNYTKEYFKIAVPTGIFYSSAYILQQVGLTMTTPATYSFLENLSCLVVPVLVWIMTRKRPSVFKFLGAILCLLSVIFLSGGFEIFSVGVGLGEILCGIAGLFYGVNIAVTGIKAKNLDVGLYLLIQFSINLIISSTYSFAFEEIAFTFNIWAILICICSVLLFTVLGWLIRTLCLKKIDPSLVAVIMPFSSVITTIISVIAGSDVLSLNLVLGAVIGVIAVIVCDLDPKRIFKKLAKKRLIKQDVDDNVSNE